MSNNKSKSIPEPTYVFIIPKKWKDSTTKKDRINISEEDILTYLFTHENIPAESETKKEKTTIIPTKQLDKLFMYYFVESIQENCIHPEVNTKDQEAKAGYPSQKSIVLSLPQLYLFPKNYSIPQPLQSFVEIEPRITTNHIVIEINTKSESDEKRYILMTIPEFEKQFCYVEKIKNSLTLDEIHKLVNIVQPTPQVGTAQVGGEPKPYIQDVYYKDANGNPANENVEDYVSYELLQKLGVERFNDFIKVNKPVSKELLYNHFVNTNTDTNNYGYIKSESTKSAEYYVDLSNKIKVQTAVHIESLFSDINNQETPNKQAAIYLCVWFLIEKWIDLYITDNFNLKFYSISGHKQIDNNQHGILIATAQYKIDIVKQQLMMVLSKTPNINLIFEQISEAITNTYKNSSYYQILKNDLSKIVGEIHGSTITNIETQILENRKAIRENQVLLIKPSKKPKLSDEKKASLVEINRALDLENQKLTEQLTELQKNSDKNTPEYINEITIEFTNHLNELLEMVNIETRDAGMLIETIKSYIFNRVERKEKGEKVFEHLQSNLNTQKKTILNKLFNQNDISQEEKTSMSMTIERTVQEIIYLIQKNFDKWFKTEIDKKYSRNKTPQKNENPIPVNNDGPDFEIIEDDDADGL